MSAQTLPAFRYMPDPVGCGAIEACDAACSICGQARGWEAAASLYARTPPDVICPWCVADGSAAQACGGAFQPDLENRESLPASVVETVLKRTPGLITWQDWDWPADDHADACVFLGEVDGAALLDEGDAAKIEACLEALKVVADDPEHRREELAGIKPAGAMAIYLFKKPVSGGYRAILDFN